jgi:hypothetical protein
MNSTPLDCAGDHVGHGVAATASDADDFDLCALVKGFFVDEFNGHVALLGFHWLGKKGHVI